MTITGLSSMAFRFAATHLLEHFVGDTLSHVRPNLNDLVVSLTVRDNTVLILLLNGNDFIFGVLYDSGLVEA